MIDRDAFKKIALYPGSFDPITNGHLDVVERASRMFDKIVIAVLNNKSKNSFLNVETRVELIKEATKNIQNVEVASFGGLTVEFAKQIGAKFLIRGLRTITDYEYEIQLCQTNQALAPEIDTVFLTTRSENNFISSSMVRELSNFNTDISKFVPENVVKYLKDDIRKVAK